MPAFAHHAAIVRGELGGSGGGSGNPSGGGGADAAMDAAAAAAEAGGEALLAALLALRVLAKLAAALAAAWATARFLLPPALSWLLRRASRELSQLAVVSACLGAAWLSGRAELSEELGAFLAGATFAAAERALAAKHGSARGTSGGGGPASSAAFQAPPQQQQQPAPAPLRATISGSMADGGLLALPQFAPPGSRNGSPRAASGGIGGLLSAPGAGADAAAAAAAAAAVQPPDARAAAAHGGSTSIESVSHVMTALFIASIGLVLSPAFLWHHAVVLLAGALAVTAVKAAVAAGVVRALGVPARTAWAAGLTMAHTGEFSFVLLGMAHQLELLPEKVPPPLLLLLLLCCCVQGLALLLF